MTPRERERVVILIKAILAGKLTGMEIKKLKGHSEVYRIRKGDIRIIFRLPKIGEPAIIAIERRSDTTYHEI